MSISINHILRKVYNLSHPIQGEIWCLHRVIEQRSEYPCNRELEITPGYLETLILSHKAQYSFESIDSILDSKSLIRRKRINISFDDGFKDIYTTAFPILKKYSIPFTIYLTTGFPEYKADIWWIQLEKCQTDSGFEKIMKQVYESDKPMAELMHHLTDTQPDYELTQSLSLSWPEIKEMVDSGLCTIGSHSVSHPGLTRICIDDCRNELRLSKRIIQEKLGVEVKHLSYPHSMVNNDVLALVKEAGYVSATLGYGGSIRRGDNPYSLNRRYITQL